MNDGSKRRRRYASSATLPPLRQDTIRPPQAGTTELASGAIVVVVACALIALIWMMTLREERDQRNELRDRMEQVLVGQAATIAETVGHEILLIDQSLTIIQSAWKQSSGAVDLEQWRQQMPALFSVADDLFIADENHIIRQDILPQAVGQGIGSAYITFPHGSLEQFESDGTQDKELLLLQGQTGAPIDARHFLMYVVRLLDHSTGWLIGASYRSEQLTKLFAGAALGHNAVIALVDTGRGILQAVVGPAARRPKSDLADTPLFSILARSHAGSWLGETPIDGVRRMHAFHRVADRDMAVVVAANWDEMMSPADRLAAGDRALASIGTAMLLAIGGMVLWELFNVRGRRRQKRILERNRTELERLRTEGAALTARSGLNAARLQMVIENSTDGIALFDSSLRLVQWNDPFRRAIGIEPVSGMPLDALVRQQVATGRFGAVAEPEAEIGRRVGILRTGEAAGLSQPGPENERLILRGLLVPDSAFMLLLHGAAAWQPTPAAIGHKVPQAATIAPGA